MNTTKNQIENILAALIILAIGLQLAIFFYHAWPFTTDDAFISWRYATHLAQGEGLRWNQGSTPVEGYSNFAWVILVASLVKLGLPIATSVKCFSICSLLAGLVFLYQFSRTFLSPLLAILPVYIFSFYKGIVWWTVSGLETSFFIAMVSFVCWQAVRAMGFSRLTDQSIERVYHPVAWILCCLGLTMLALTRFEGVVWCVIIGTFIVCNKQIRIQHYRSLLWCFFIFLVLPYTVYFIWRVIYFERLLPNSYACKASANGFTFALVLDYLQIAYPCLAFGLPYFFSRRDCRHILLWLPSLIYSLMLYQANPVIANCNRLFLGAFSLLAVLPVLGVHVMFDYFYYTAKHNALLSTVVILLFTSIFIQGYKPDEIKAAVAHYQQRSEMRFRIARQLNHEVPENARVLLADCGIIPFFARNDIHFIDSLCLNNREMTRGNQKYTVPLYARRIQNVVKPEWVIDTWYPLLNHGNDLNDELQKLGFYNDYTLVASYPSHLFAYEENQVKEREVDFLYRIYKRRLPPKVLHQGRVAIESSSYYLFRLQYELI